MLRRLEPGEPIDILEMLFAEARLRAGRPWVMLNMVESVDGATAVDGGASALNDRDDRRLFLALRAVADVVMNGAETVRSENLGPLKMSEEMARWRHRSGLAPLPEMVILTRSLDLDPEHRIFSKPDQRPTVITGTDVEPSRLKAVGEVAKVVQVDPLDGKEIISALAVHSVILCEGGPTINAQLISAEVVDEVNVTIAPKLALGDSKRIAAGPPLQPPLDMRLDRTLVGDESLFLRFVRG